MVEFSGTLLRLNKSIVRRYYTSDATAIVKGGEYTLSL
jgi:hypothetical protein